jgi:hypothetical protein
MISTIQLNAENQRRATLSHAIIVQIKGFDTAIDVLECGLIEADVVLKSEKAIMMLYKTFRAPLNQNPSRGYADSLVSE